MRLRNYEIHRDSGFFRESISIPNQQYARLREIQGKYSFIATIHKSYSSYGNWVVKLKNPHDHLGFFSTLSEMPRFLDAHVKGLRSGNCL